MTGSHAIASAHWMTALVTRAAERRGNRCLGKGETSEQGGGARMWGALSPRLPLLFILYFSDLLGKNLRIKQLRRRRSTPPTHRGAGLGLGREGSAPGEGSHCDGDRRGGLPLHSPVKQLAKLNARQPLHTHTHTHVDIRGK